MNLNNPEVSVVIPTYNYAHFLKKCLKSLISQAFTNWEALVINNFSTDDTVAVVEDFSDKRIRLVNFRNNGVIATSRNKGIELARSNLIAFLDSDDIWYPEKVRSCLKEFDSGADLVCHGMRYIVNGKHWKDAAYKFPVSSDFYSLLYRNPHIFTSATIIRKECLLKVGGFDESSDIATAEDYDLWLKLSKKNLRFCFIKDILGEYNCHQDSFSRQAFFHIKACLNVINKYSCDTNFAPLHNFRISRAKALVYYGVARNFQREGKRFTALRFFLRALATSPLLLSPYAGLLLTMLPSSFSNLITHDLSPKDWLQQSNSIK